MKMAEDPGYAGKSASDEKNDVFRIYVTEDVAAGRDKAIRDPISGTRPALIETGLEKSSWPVQRWGAVHDAPTIHRSEPTALMAWLGDRTRNAELDQCGVKLLTYQLLQLCCPARLISEQGRIHAST